MIQLGVPLLLCIAAVIAPPPAPLHCPPRVLGSDNFDSGLLPDVWYEVRQTSAPYERHGTCGVIRFTSGNHNSLGVTYGWLDKNNQQRQVAGEAKSTSTKCAILCTNSEAQMKIKFDNTEWDKYTFFYLEKNAYFGIYTCIDQIAYVSVFAQTLKVDDEDLKSVYEAMDKSGLDSKTLKVISQEDCARGI